MRAQYDGCQTESQQHRIQMLFKDIVIKASIKLFDMDKKGHLFKREHKSEEDDESAVHPIENKLFIVLGGLKGLGRDLANCLLRVSQSKSPRR